VSGTDVRTIQAGDLPEAPFPEVKEAFRVWIAEEAFDRFTERGGKDLTREVGGVLVGRACRDSAGPYVRVDDVIEALHADEKSTELTFTHDTWKHIHEEMDTKYEGKSIVGWCHTHPGFGVFLSERDQFIHTSFFDLPHQVALVFDPKSREHGVFTWHEGEPIRSRRYFVGDREHLWDGARELAPTTKESEAEPEEPEATSDPAPPSREADLPFFAIGALLLLVLGGFGGWWIGRGSSEDTLREELNRARFEGMRETSRLLNADLLAFVRASLGGNGVLVPLNEGLALLDEGLAALPNDVEGRAKLAAGRAKLTRITVDQRSAEFALATLESLSRRRNRETAQLVKLASEQRQALGQLYAEFAAFAAENGDRRRAERLLKAAAAVDPQGAERYARQREKLGGEEDR